MKKINKVKTGRLKSIVIPLGSIVLIIIFFVFLSRAFKKEAISVKDILEKQNWKDLAPVVKERIKTIDAIR